MGSHGWLLEQQWRHYWLFRLHVFCNFIVCGGFLVFRLVFFLQAKIRKGTHSAE